MNALFVLPEGRRKGLAASRSTIARWIRSAIQEAYRVKGMVSKNMILDQAFKYITELKRQNDELLLNGGNNEQASEIKKLRRELSEIQKENARYIELLKSNDICLYDDPTLSWKGNSRNSKASLIASADQTPKLPLCLNGNQLGTSNQGTTVHGITFNVGHNLQKQTANVVPVQRTCNLVTPITISGVYPLGQNMAAKFNISSNHCS
ncbi:unnamed protein product [Ranitomeya imitator]|uniref:Uncharacterized protein n=1 Tax=Ranitomeya imitator TaxID=111125 RepID=A0ABN9KP28_9NEOB|nr:unnamed protein product [Ranitomeya imitator]